MHDASDMDLLRDYVRQNSEAAFAGLVERHIALVYSAALRQTGIAAHAEEITQAVFILLARKAAVLRPHTILDAWLHETTRLTAWSFLRGERRRQSREQEAYMQSTLQDAAGDPVWNQLAPWLDEAISRLGQRDRQAVVLRYFKGKNLRDVAAALNITEAAAQRRVHRAVGKLQKFFFKRGVDSTAATIAETISAHSVQAAPVALAKAVTAIAVAKGATASISTLTLVKGALKIMAWTNAKTAIVVGTTAIALTFGAGYFSLFHQPHPKQTGKLNLPVGNVTPMIAYGYSRDFILLAPDGSLWSWGEERLGWPVLGYTNIHNSVSLRRIGNETDWVSIAVGDSQNLAIKSDGTLWGWGENLNYQLGDGTKITRPTPVPSIPGND
jgi:RNA polymerase sigma factor (sigma-70 family)